MTWAVPQGPPFFCPCEGYDEGMPGRFDVIVVGAGPGGLSAAFTAARRGLRVLLIEQKPIEDAGRDWCDFVEAGVFAAAAFPFPPRETWHAVTSPSYASPDMQTTLRAQRPEILPFLYIDRKPLHAWMLAQLPPNVTIVDRRRVVAPLRAGARVFGVIVEHARSHEEHRAPWVIDAGGLTAPIASQVPYDAGHRSEDLQPGDTYVARKEIRFAARPAFMTGSDDLMVPRWRGGFAWFVAHAAGTLDVGIAHPFEAAQGLSGDLQRLRTYAGVSGSPLRSGGGRLPARRCRTRLVGDGWAVVGDAAWQVNPASGGGISPAILAGGLAADAIADACGARDPRAAVWRYPFTYFREQGAAFAGLDVLRRMFQALGDRDVRRAMQDGLLRYDDFLAPMLHQRLPRPCAADAERLWAGRKSSLLLAKILAGFARAQVLQAAYQALPDEQAARSIHRWEQRIRRLVR